jgi:hypothetical protein
MKRGAPVVVITPCFDLSMQTTPDVEGGRR